jgi:ribosome-associated protein
MAHATPMYDIDTASEDEAYGPSKSALKREAAGFLRLAEQLVALPPALATRLTMSEEIRLALDEAYRIKSHGARKRHLHHMGKLLRQQSDVGDLQQAIERQMSGTTAQTALFHQIERWRDRLLQEGDSALAELIADHPEFDRQRLRQLMREANREAAQEQPPRAARLLFQLLRQGLG